MAEADRPPKIKTKRRSTMKKLISLILALIMVAGILVACGAKEKDYTLGLGVAVSSTPAKLKVSTTAATVVLDAEGKVVLCRLDAVDVQPKYADDALVVANEYKTKGELGDAYGMLSDYGSKLAEWHTQAKFFEDYVIGKSRDDIAAIKTGDAELVSGCTIDVTDFVKAIVAACDSEQKIAFKSIEEMSAGLSINASVAEKNGKANYTSDVACVVMADGKAVAALVDVAESSLKLTDGEGSDFAYAGTKLELGDKYGMVAYAGASAEWYVQAKTYAATAVGKTVAEIENLATTDVAGCTIAVEPYKVVLVKAAKAAR